MPHPGGFQIVDVLAGMEEQTDARGMHGIAHDVAQAADARRHPAPSRQIEPLFRRIRHSVQQGRAACDHHARTQHAFVSGPDDFPLHQVEHFLHARLQDLRDVAPRKLARRPITDRRHLHGLMAMHQVGARNAMLHLDLFRVRLRSQQADRQILGQILPADGEHRRMSDAAVQEDRQIGRASAEVDHRHPQFALLRAEDSLARRQRLEDDIHYIEARAVHAFDDVLRRGDGPGDDMHIHFQAVTRHAQGFADPFLVVDHKLARQDVQDAAFVRDHRQGSGALDGPADVVPRHFLFLQRHHAFQVLAGDVAAGNASVDRIDLHRRHQLRLLDRLLNGLDRTLDIDHDAFAQSPRWAGADADDIEGPFIRHFGNDRANLRRPDIQSHQNMIPLRHSAHPLPRTMTRSAKRRSISLALAPSPSKATSRNAGRIFKNRLHC